MSLLGQLEQAAGGRIPTWYAEDYRQFTGLSKREFDSAMRRIARLVPMREYIAGTEQAEGPLMILIKDTRDGLLIQLWERR
jgi:hypothetical protein